jgi:hypothetical protein
MDARDNHRRRDYGGTPRACKFYFENKGRVYTTETLMGHIARSITIDDLRFSMAIKI